MKKTKLIEPYQKDGKTNLSFCSGKTGVYIIQKGREIHYVGFSGSDIYKTILRHFQSWNDKTQIRVTFPKMGYKVRIVLCTKQQAMRLERALIIKHRPKANPDKLSFYKEPIREELTEYQKFMHINETPPF